MAFRPRGEATHVSDHHLDSNHESHHRVDSTGYPNAGESTSKACRGCGHPIPANQHKCATYLQHHIEPVDTEVSGQADQTPVPRVIFAVVEAACDYTTLAKGAAACTLLEQRESNPLEEFDNWLSESVTVYLLGGSAMTVQVLKDQTEDIDLALGLVSEFEHVYQTLIGVNSYNAGVAVSPEGDVQKLLNREGPEWDWSRPAFDGDRLRRDHTRLLRWVPS